MEQSLLSVALAKDSTGVGMIFEAL